jgi:hypothetical protein
MLMSSRIHQMSIKSTITTHPAFHAQKNKRMTLRRNPVKGNRDLAATYKMELSPINHPPHEKVNDQGQD